MGGGAGAAAGADLGGSGVAASGTAGGAMVLGELGSSSDIAISSKREVAASNLLAFPAG